MVVLKVSHCKHGDPRSLAAQAADYRKEFERVKNIYKDIPDVVPGEAWLVARNVRKFFGTGIRDLFTDISFEELKQLIAKEPGFADTIKKFTADSLNHEAQTGEVVDFLGPKNLSVDRTEDSHRLILLDPHAIQSTHSSDQERNERLRKDLEYLKTVTGVGGDKTMVMAVG